MKRIRIIASLILGILMTLAMAQSCKNRQEKSQTKNVFTPNQNTYGNWEPTPFLDQGWAGYHIVSQVIKMKNLVSYSTGSGDNKSNYTVGPRCPDGDCKYKKQTSIYRVGTKGFEKHSKLAPNIPVGHVAAYDNGSAEETKLLNSQNVAIASITEREAQSKLRFDDAQETTLVTFNAEGIIPKVVGHIQESDAPHLFNQPETVYETVNGQDKFLTTVIERIGLESEGKESFRLATLWCQSDKFMLNKSTFTKYFAQDEFDISQCGKANMPIISDTHNGAMSGAKQLFTGRSASTVEVQNPANGQHELKYKADSNVSILFGNGTEYMIEHGGKNVVFINSEKYQSMKNCPADGILGGTCNSPKAKMVTFNRQLSGGFEGIKEKHWLNTSKNQNAVALLVQEITGQMASDFNGNTCAKDDHGNFVDAKLKSLDSKDSKASKRQLALTCKPAVKYTLHYYILFPPAVKDPTAADLFGQLKQLDRVLAAFPDQTQSSPELNNAEEYSDQIIALERYLAAKDPSILNIKDMVDLNTEEDHLTAQNKIWDLFTDLGLVKKRSDREKDVLPAASTNEGSTPDIQDDLEI